MTTLEPRNGRSVIPLSLALLVFNALGQSDPDPKVPGQESHADCRELRGEDPAGESARLFGDFPVC